MQHLLDVFALGFLLATLAALSLEDCLSVLVNLQSDNLDLGGVEVDWNSGTVCLLPLQSLDVDDPLLTVASDNLALLPLVVSPGHLDLIILSHWNASDVVLCTELLGEWCTHNLPSDAEKEKGTE